MQRFTEGCNRVFSVLIILSVSFQLAVAQVPAYIPTNNLIGYWPLDGNFQNAFGSTHNGTNSGAVSATGRAGMGSVGMRFNGVNQFATLPSSVMNQVSGSFTVSFWLRADSLVPNNLGYDAINDRSSSIWNFRFRLMFGQTNFPTYSPDSSYMDHINANSQMPRAAGPYPSPDGWVHYALVYSGTASAGVMRLYYNGQLSGVSASTSLMSGARPINIGRGISPTMPGGYGFFGGVLDEIAIWNRALSDAEILNISQSCVVSIISQPTNQSVNVGGSTTFSVSPANASASVQWQTLSSGQWVALVNGPDISGVNTNTLSLSNVGFGLNATQFRAFIFDSTCTGSSQVVTLTVNCLNLVNQSPASTSQLVGGTATFVAGAVVPNAQYQWQVNTGSGFSNVTNFGQFSGANTNTLTLSNLQRSNDGFAFRCNISFLGCTATTQTGVLSVLCNDLITQHPVDFNGVVGGNANFAVDPLPNAVYSWYINSGFGFNLISNNGQFSGANTPTLTMSNLSLQNHNSAFIAMVSSEGCADTSALAILRVATGTNTTELQRLNWQMYPNPASKEFTLDLTSKNEEVRVRIYDLTGRVHFEQLLEPAKHQLSVEQWSAGVFIVEVANDRQRLVVRGR